MDHTYDSGPTDHNGGKNSYLLGKVLAQRIPRLFVVTLA